MLYSNDPIERWWGNSSAQTPFPGKIALFVGAGVSMNSPTCLPSGADLTTALLNHLLDKRAADEILSVFRQCSSVIGRQLPRLEHILDIACNRAKIEPQAPNSDPRNLLRLFENRTPNSLHRLIARFLIEKRSWVITTNFDECIEHEYSEMCGKDVPVHVIRSEKPSLDPLDYASQAEWGLVKLHGTIRHGVDELGSTLSDLVPRLPPQFRELLTRIFESVDLVVVAGYSGTDHFDVNAWIRGRVNAKVKPRLIWVMHSEKNSECVDEDKECEPFISWHRATGKQQVLHRRTEPYLATLLGQPLETVDCKGHAGEQLSLPRLLDLLYRPSEAQRHLNGAYLSITIGLGRLAEEEFRQFRHYLKSEGAQRELVPKIFSRMGMHDEANHSLISLSNICAPSILLQRLKIFRRIGRPVRALIEIAMDCFRPKPDDPRSQETFEVLLEAIECVLDFVEDAQTLKMFRSKLPRRLFSATISCLLTRFGSAPVKISLALEGKMEVLGIRCGALLDDEEALIGQQLWSLLDEQFSYPDFYLDSGPAIQGYYLIALSTCWEEDRLADLVDTYLLFVRILLVEIRRKWPRRSGFHFNPYRANTIPIKVVEKLLGKADHLARALDEPHLLVEVARQRVQADQILGGFQYWRQQRLYLG